MTTADIVAGVDGMVCEALVLVEGIPRCSFMLRDQPMLSNPVWERLAVGRWFAKQHPGFDCADWPQNIPPGDGAENRFVLLEKRKWRYLMTHDEVVALLTSLQAAVDTDFALAIDGVPADPIPEPEPTPEPTPVSGTAWERGLDWFRANTGKKGSLTPTVKLGGLIDGKSITGGKGVDGFDSTEPAHLLRCHLYQLGADGAKGHSDQTFEECLIEDLRPAAGAHSDGIQVMSGMGIVIRNSWIDIGPDGNGALQIKTDKGDLEVEVDGCVLGGGIWYAVRVNGTTGRTAKVSFRNCVFLPPPEGRPEHKPLLVRGNSQIVDLGGNMMADGTPITA